MAKGKNTVAIVTELALPVTEQAGVSLWDVRFEKEGAMWYLRIIIDKDGGVTIDDCETVSRALDKLLDQVDPIEQSYCLEVSSPGIERDLVKPEHFEKFIGQEIQVRFIRAIEGVRDFVGVLTGFENRSATIRLEDDLEMTFELGETSFVRAVDNYDEQIDEGEQENE